MFLWRYLNFLERSLEKKVPQKTSKNKNAKKSSLSATLGSFATTVEQFCAYENPGNPVTKHLFLQKTRTEKVEVIQIKTAPSCTRRTKKMMTFFVFRMFHVISFA